MKESDIIRREIVRYDYNDNDSGRGTYSIFIYLNDGTSS